MAYLDEHGLNTLWGKIKTVFQEKLISGTNIKTINNESILGSGNLVTPDENYLSTVINRIYPIGSIYISTNTANPSTYLGGTWEPFGEGRCLLGAGTYNDGTDERTFSAGNSSGKYNHTLTAAQIPSKPHNHTITVTNGTNVVRTGNGTIGSQRGTINNSTTATYNYIRTEHKNVDMKANTITASSSNNSSVAASAHNNMQPYIVVCMWIRVPTV